jgi:hypothetical protein
VKLRAIRVYQRSAKRRPPYMAARSLPHERA